MEHREFAQRLVAVFHEGRRQRPRVAQFARQQRHPRLLAQRQIGHAGHRRVEQFGHRALMHGGILPHVEAGEMEAETIHGAAQQPQPAARDHAGIVRDQRAVENVEIGLELLRRCIGRGLADRRPRWFRPRASTRSRPAAHRCRTPPADRARRFGAATVRASARPARAIRRRRRQDAPPATIRRRAHAAPRDRSAARGCVCRRSVPRITSAVTNGLPSRSPPIQLPIRRKDASSPWRRHRPVQPVLQRAMQPRHRVQEV